MLLCSGDAAVQTLLNEICFLEDRFSKDPRKAQRLAEISLARINFLNRHRQAGAAFFSSSPSA
jgi:hypothetical protein